MAVVGLLTPLLVLGALAAVLLLAPWKVVGGVLIALSIGVFVAVKERRDRPSARVLAPGEAPELHATLERLCVVADLPKPALVLEPEAQPNSWVLSLGRAHAQLHITQGLVDRLEPAELEAVLAHELAHVAQRDATVMTVVGGPGTALMEGGRTLVREWFWPFGFGGLLSMLIGWLASLGARLLSRGRELAADAGAVALTGNPAALASALTKVSAGLVAIPAKDLREAATRDAFHLLPAGKGKSRIPLPASHPPLRARIARLERLEAHFQAARPARRG